MNEFFWDITVPIKNWDLQEVGKITLLNEVFNVPIRKDILHRLSLFLITILTS